MESGIRPALGKTRLSITAATAHAACTTAMDIGADAILTVSQSGVTAQMVSRFRPRTTVVALLMDPQVLGTLPDATFSDGMAEVIKYGCIFDESFYSFLEQRPSRGEIMADIEYVLYTCCNLKRKVVVEDERDTGMRRLLNFGHTLGHAYELAGHYETWTHGQAVAAGMVRAAELGVGLGLTPPSVAARITDLVTAFGLPSFIDCTGEQYAAAVGLDKKGAGDSITLILLDRPGHAIPYKMKKAALLKLL